MADRTIATTVYAGWMVSDIIQAAGVAAVVVTLYFLAIQTRKLQRQNDLTNLLGRYEVLNHSAERYDVALTLLFERPDLRPYVYSRKQVDLVSDDLQRALVIADLMAGAVDYGIRVQSRFPDATTDADWMANAHAMAEQPLFQMLFAEIPEQYPDLMRVVRL